MYQALKERDDFAKDFWDRFSKNMFYVPGDFNDRPVKSYKDLHDKVEKVRKALKIEDNILFHLATPSQFYGTLVKKLNQAGFMNNDKGWRRVIIEKPSPHLMFPIL